MIDCFNILLKMDKPTEAIPTSNLALLKLVYQHCSTTLENNIPADLQEKYENRLSLKEKAYLAMSLFKPKKSNPSPKSTPTPKKGLFSKLFN